jgi:hypothetical protein
MFYLLLCLIGFILLILGTWEGGNMKNRENKKCFQKAKKSRLSLPDLHTSHRQTANALMFVGRGAGAKDISGQINPLGAVLVASVYIYYNNAT